MDVLICLFIFLLIICPILSRRGPHHPRSEMSKVKPPKLDEHITHEHEHLRQDMGSWALKKTDFNDMTDDEKHFYYFKAHDSDNNDALDGLEMLQAATHRSGHFHKLDERNDDLDDIEDELNHIVGIIDDFINFADLNHDGYLNYPEYARAINTNNDVDHTVQTTTENLYDNNINKDNKIT